MNLDSHKESYLVPARAVVEVARLQATRPTAWRVHRMRRPLVLGHVMCFHGPRLLVFELGEWLLRVPRAQVVCPRGRVIHALRFGIQTPVGAHLLAWPDVQGNAEFARPTRRRDTLLDVMEGQEILWSGERRVVRLVVCEVWLYRCSVQGDNGMQVASGRSWLAG